MSRMIDKIMQKIENEVERRNHTIDPLVLKNNTFQNINMQKNIQTTPLYRFAKKVAKKLERYGLYGFVNFVKNRLTIKQYKVTYELKDFIKHEDKTFIENAYHLILKQNVDKKKENLYLEKFPLEKRAKVEVLIDIYFSKERENNNVIILGMRKRYVLSLLYKIPFVGNSFYNKIGYKV